MWSVVTCHWQGRDEGPGASSVSARGCPLLQAVPCSPGMKIVSCPGPALAPARSCGGCGWFSRRGWRLLCSGGPAGGPDGTGQALSGPLGRQGGRLAAYRISKWCGAGMGRIFVGAAAAGCMAAAGRWFGSGSGGGAGGHRSGRQIRPPLPARPAVLLRARLRGRAGPQVALQTGCRAMPSASSCWMDCCSASSAAMRSGSCSSSRACSQFSFFLGAAACCLGPPRCRPAWLLRQALPLVAGGCCADRAGPGCVADCCNQSSTPPSNSRHTPSPS